MSTQVIFFFYKNTKYLCPDEKRPCGRLDPTSGRKLEQKFAIPEKKMLQKVSKQTFDK